MLTHRRSRGGLGASAFRPFFSKPQYSPYLRFPTSDEHTRHPGTLLDRVQLLVGGLGISIPNTVSRNAMLLVRRPHFR